MATPPDSDTPDKKKGGSPAPIPGRCGAKLDSSGTRFCQLWPLKNPNTGRCKRHSFLGRRLNANLHGWNEGAARYWENVREAKKLGLWTKWPTNPGWTARSPRAELRELRIQGLEIVKTTLAALGPPSDKPLAEQTNAELLHGGVVKALLKLHWILDLRCPKANLELMVIQKDAAKSLIGSQIKVDDQNFRNRTMDRIAEALVEIERRKTDLVASGEIAE